MDVSMDVYGRRPKSEEGKYFRNNRCAWHPLATYTCEVAPDVTSKCQYWHTNDGDGLNDDDSVKLADALQAEIDSGRSAQYAEKAELGKWYLLHCPLFTGSQRIERTTDTNLRRSFRWPEPIRPCSVAECHQGRPKIL
jgi:hypothetical protein